MAGTTDDFMARHSRQYRLWQFTVHQVQIGAAHAAGQDFNEQLVWTRCRDRALFPLQRLAGCMQNHGAHVDAPDVRMLAEGAMTAHD